MLKIKKIMKTLGIGFCCLFFLGCSDESFVLEQENYEVMQEKTEQIQRDEKASQEEQKETEEILENKEEKTDEQVEIAVHICGEVNQPGVYVFQKKARIYEGIQKAGGFTKEAVEDYLNLALVLEDGMKIEVPSQEMLNEWKENVLEEDMGISYGNSQSPSGKEKESDGKINLNTAREEELCTLPGIGESRAKSIISYREENGGFQRIEDVMNISGIKEAAFEKIKEYITVSK